DDSVAQTTQVIELLPGRRLRFAIDARPTTSVPVLLENRIVSINEAWVSNRPYCARFPNSYTISGWAFAWPPSDDVDECTIAAGFTSMELDSPYGLLTIETTGTAEMRLMDYRLNKWAGDQRYFWFGVTGKTLPEAGLRYEVMIQFPPLQPGTPPAPIVSDPPLLNEQVIYKTPEPVDVVLPTPKAIAWSRQNLNLGNALTLRLPVEQKK